MCDKRDPMFTNGDSDCWFREETTNMCLNFSSECWHEKCPSCGKKMGMEQDESD